MTRYRMDDGTIIDTENASQSWDEDTHWDGSNQISRATGSQWCHEKLCRSRKGRYYKECWSQWQGSTPHVEWVSEREAIRWLLLMGHDVPEELAHLVEDIVE